jgi:hypothetical protein
MANFAQRIYSRGIDDRNLETQVSGALVANETFLQDARDEAYTLPNFTVHSNFFGGKPRTVDFDRNADGRADGSAKVNYSWIGNLTSIEIDNDNDGKVDTTFEHKMSSLGNSLGFEVYNNHTGEKLAESTSDYYSFFRSIDAMTFRRPGSDNVLGQIKPTFNWASRPNGLDIYIKSSIKPDAAVTLHRTWFRTLTGFGPTA